MGRQFARERGYPYLKMGASCMVCHFVSSLAPSQMEWRRSSTIWMGLILGESWLLWFMSLARDLRALTVRLFSPAALWFGRQCEVAKEFVKD